MIGILSSEENKSILSENIHKLLKSTSFKKNVSVIVFTITDVNLSSKTVLGNAIFKDKIKKVEAKLPDIIFNFSVQYKGSDIKKLRELVEAKDISVINASNQYNQSSILNILSINDRTLKFVLPYIECSENDTCFSLPENCNLIVKQEHRSSLTKFAFIEPSLSGFYINSKQTRSFYEQHDFLKIIHSIMPCKKWILLKIPDLMKRKNQLLITRVYLQRLRNAKWKVLTKNNYPNDVDIHDQLIEKTNDISLQLVYLINCFITDLGICYIDFIFDSNGSPYFFNFSGYDNKLIDDSQNQDTQIEFLKNMLEYTKGFINKPKGEFGYVD